MNTFLALMRESKVEDFNGKDGALAIVRKIVHVAKSVENALSDSITSHDEGLLLRCRSYLANFFDIVVEKIDCSTAHLLRFVDDLMNDRQEIQVEEHVDGVSIGIWSSFNEIRPIRKAIQFEKLNFQLDVPKQILMHDARFVHRIVRLPIDKFTSSAYVSVAGSTQIGDKFVVGDVILVEMLIPPPQPVSIRAKKWVLRDRSSASLNIRRVTTYPSSVACRCVFKVSDDVVMGDDVRVAVWNDESKTWSEDGVSDFQYSESNRLVQFYITQVGAIALVRDRVGDLPYKKWSLSALHVPPKAKNTPLPTLQGFSNNPNSWLHYEQQARLVVQTQRLEFIIEICGTACKLVKPTMKQFSDLIGVEMTPGHLLYKLHRRGINIMPTAHDCSKLKCVTPKVSGSPALFLKKMIIPVRLFLQARALGA